MKFNVALLQIAPHGSDQKKNLEKGLEYCSQAKAMGADLALFPELWNIGFAMCPFDGRGRREWEASAIDRQSEFFQQFVKRARALNINIGLTYLEKHHPKPKNTVSIITGKGDLALNYSKVFICNFGKEQLSIDTPNYDEIGCDFNCTPGDSFDVGTLNGKEGPVKVGAMICADREFPEAATELMLNGAELFVAPNACFWNDIRTALLKARSFENLAGVAMTNYPAPQNNGHSQAHSCVAWESGAPVNSLIARAGEKEEIVVASFNISEIRAFRATESWRIDYRRKWHGA